MSLSRVLEPEVMDTAEEASDYDAMDHSEVNRRFVDDLIAAIESGEGAGVGVQGSGFRVQASENAVPSTEYSVLGTVSPPTTQNPPATPHSSEPRTLNPEPFLDVLDVGTGTALIPIQLCKQYPGCRIMAADAAVSMLELARYNVEVNSLTERIELAHIDAKRLPFADGMFDVVMSNSIIHHIPEPIHALREAVRVTKPGGLLFFRDLLRPESEAELNQLVATYTPGANPNQQRLFTKSLHAALSLDEIRSLISSLGFASDTVQQTSDRHWTWSTIKSFGT